MSYWGGGARSGKSVEMRGGGRVRGGGRGEVWVGDGVGGFSRRVGGRDGWEGDKQTKQTKFDVRSKT